MRKILAALVAVLVLGTLGYALIEDMNFADSLLSAVSVMATVSSPQDLSQPGKLFTAALIVSSVGLIIAAIARLLSPPTQEEEGMLTDFFGSGNENLVMKEVKIGKALSGLNKEAILERYGAVVVGVKHKGGFDINAPLGMKVKGGSSVLLLGTPAALMRIERKK